MGSRDDRGVDDSGYVINRISTENISAGFWPVLEETISRLVAALGTNLHSVYLYGSVGRGDAVFGVSDLDLSVIVHTALSDDERAKVALIESAMSAEYSSISKLECDFGNYHQAMVVNEYEWQFWLKHLCACVWGINLAETIAPYRPLLRVGLAMNKDVSIRMARCLEQLNDENFQTMGKSIAKKLLRTHYSLYCEKDNSYYASLEKIANCLIRYEQDSKTVVQEALASCDVIASADSVVRLIDTYGSVVRKRYLEYGGGDLLEGR